MMNFINKSFLIIFINNIHPIVFLVQNMNNLASFDLQFIVYAWGEVMKYYHFGLGSEAVLLLDAHPHQGLDGGRPGDPTH